MSDDIASLGIAIDSTQTGSARSKLTEGEKLALEYAEKIKLVNPGRFK